MIKQFYFKQFNLTSFACSQFKCQTFLLDPYIRHYQVPPLWVREDLGVMAMKEYSTFSKSSVLLEPHHQLVLCYIQYTHWREVLPLCRDAVSVFCSPTQLGWNESDFFNGYMILCLINGTLMGFFFVMVKTTPTTVSVVKNYKTIIFLLVSFSLKSEWQKVTSSLQNYEYSSWV